MRVWDDCYSKATTSTELCLVRNAGLCSTDWPSQSDAVLAVFSSMRGCTYPVSPHAPICRSGARKMPNAMTDSGQVATPQILIGFQRKCPDLTRFRRPNTSDPRDTEPRCVPESLHLNCLAGPGDIADSVQARTIPAYVDCVGTLNKGLTILIYPAHFDADHLGNTVFTAVDSPKVGNRR